MLTVPFSRTVFIKDRSTLPPIKGEKRPRNKTAALLKSHRVGLFNKNNATTRSMPASPSLGASKSSLPSAAALTSVPAPLDEKSKKLQALKTPLLHLLAVRPVSVKFLSQTLNCTTDECMQVLSKFGKEARLDPSKFDLTDRGFKELDVWAFKYPSQDDRQAAIDRAVSAYDRLRLSREEKIWQVLLPKEERGKGKILSKLQLHNGPIQKVSTPRINVQPTEDSNNGGYATGNDSETRRDRLAPSDAEPMARSASQDPIKKKRVSEKEAQSKRLLSKNPKKATPAVKAKESKPAKGKEVKKETLATEGKIKSAEFVHDSDEDVEMEDTITLDVQSVKPKATTNAGKVPPKKLAKTTTKSASNPVNPRTVEVDGRKEQTSVPGSKARGKPTPSPSSSGTKHGLSDANRGSTSMKRTYSHQRTTSSPIKPSPLGSSPPTNASDFDNEGPSLLASSSSSSPLMTQARNNSDTPTHKPGVARKIVKPVQNTSEHTLKRKANDLDSGIHDHDTSIANDHEPVAKRHQTSAVSPPTSDRSGSVSPPVAGQMIEQAQKFKAYWAKYEQLYHALSSFPDPPQEKVEQVLKMHNRLIVMKAELSDGIVS